MSKTPLSSVDGQFLEGLTFCQRVYEILEATRSTPKGQEMLRMRRGFCKRLAEELLPIAKYIQRRHRAGRYISIKWVSGNQPFDAELKQTGAYVDKGHFPSAAHLEVTCAVHPNDYLAREHLNQGEPVFGLDGLARLPSGGIVSVPMIQIGDDFIEHFAELTLKAIREKARKRYPENTCLIVQCSLNRLYSQEEWEKLISTIRSHLPNHSFLEVFLCDTVSDHIAIC